MYKNSDLNQVVGTILQCLSDVSEKKYYGTTILIDVLRGSENKKVISDSLNNVRSYGALSNIGRSDLAFLIDWLIEKDFILKTKGLNPVLHPTYKGLHYAENISSQQLRALKKKLEDENFSGY